MLKSRLPWKQAWQRDCCSPGYPGTGAVSCCSVVLGTSRACRQFVLGQPLWQGTA